jgi:hypothetical protein
MPPMMPPIFLQAGDHTGAVLLRLANECIAGRARLRQRVGVHDPVVVALDLFERMGGRLAFEVAQLVDRAALHGHWCSDSEQHASDAVFGAPIASSTHLN